LLPAPAHHEAEADAQGQEALLPVGLVTAMVTPHDASDFVAAKRQNTNAGKENGR
jgi:hypothetical protein